MTDPQRRYESARYVRNVKKIESGFITPIYKALQAEIKRFTAYLREHGNDQAKHDLPHLLKRDGLEAAILRIYSHVGLYSYRQTAAQIRKSARLEQKAGFGDDKELIARIIVYLRLYLLSKAVLPILETTRVQILRELERGIQEGQSSEVIARRLESDVLTLYRARMIVRTEILKAFQYGRYLASGDSPWLTVSEWITCEDERVRPSHQDMDGVTVPEGNKFRVPIYVRNAIVGYDYMTGPGDENASAGNVINCRCTLSTVAARDKNGRLIPKTDRNSKVSVILPGERFEPTTLITI